MKLFIKLFLIMVITSFSVAIASAQSPPQPPAPPKPTKIIGKAEIYESKPITTVVSVFLNRNNKQTIRAKFEVPSDRAGAKPNGIEFFYQSLSDNGYKYKDNRKVAFIIDNKSKAQGEARLIASCNLKKEKECYEFLTPPPERSINNGTACGFEPMAPTKWRALRRTC